MPLIPGDKYYLNQEDGDKLEQETGDKLLWDGLWDWWASPDKLSLTITGYAPTVMVDTPIQPDVLSLTVIGYAPNVIIGTVI